MAPLITNTPVPGVCRTGVLSFLSALPPLLLSTAGEGVTFSGAGGVEALTELWALSERVDSVKGQQDDPDKASKQVIHLWCARVHARSRASSPVVPCALLAALLEDAEVDGVCVEERAELRVRPPDGVSAFPLTSWGGRVVGTLCLREEGRVGAGEGSLLAVTLDDTRLFLSGLQTDHRTQKINTNCHVRHDLHYRS